MKLSWSKIFKKYSMDQKPYITPNISLLEGVTQMEMSQDFSDSVSSQAVTITINKNVSEPMGMTLRKDKHGRCVIARIMIGGLIHRHGSLHVGDEIVEVNAESVVGDSLEFVQRILKSAHGSVYLTIVPNNWREPPNCEIYVKAMFDYDPLEDSMVPSSQMGLMFYVGDILRIISKDDNNWWQAQHLDHDVDSPARLIPSSELQESRAVTSILDKVTNEKKTSNSSKTCNPFLMRQKKRKKRSSKTPIVCNGIAHSLAESKCRNFYESEKLYDQLHLFLSDLEFSPYEEVVEIAEFSRRSLILLGAHGVGRRHIKNALIQSYPHLFSAPVPHTSKSPLANQINGKDYHFVSHEQMLSDIANNLYLEFGKQDDVLYGIKLETVRQIINCRIIPVLDVEPQALRLLRNGEFAPFVVFISPPQLSILSESTKDAFDGCLEKLSEDSELLEMLYRPFIDMEIINYNIEDTIKPIVQALNELHSNPQWIPVAWIY